MRWCKCSSHYKTKFHYKFSCLVIYCKSIYIQHIQAYLLCNSSETLMNKFWKILNNYGEFFKHDQLCWCYLHHTIRIDKTYTGVQFIVKVYIFTALLFMFNHIRYDYIFMSFISSVLSRFSKSCKNKLEPDICSLSFWLIVFLGCEKWDFY